MRIIAILSSLLLVAGCASTGTTPDKQLAEREQLKREILEELRAEGAILPPSTEPRAEGAIALPDIDLREEARLVLASPARQPEQPEQLGQLEQILSNLGTVGGRIVRAGEPVPDCQVRLIRVDEETGYVRGDRAPEDVMVTTTDERGRYRFESVAVGWYKLKWAVPGATHWVRFFSTEPDLTVEAGRTTMFRDIDTARRAIGGN